MNARPWWIPPPTAWLSAVFLYILLGVLGTAWMAVLPWLLELLEKSPRLAGLVMLAMWTSPVWVVGAIHYVSHGALDVFGPRSAAIENAGLASVWAGAQAWLVIAFASITASLVAFIVFPPDPNEESLKAFFTGAVNILSGRAGAATLQTIAWVVIAAQLYNLERAARKQPG
jgi:hypothetical protein